MKQRTLLVGAIVVVAALIIGGGWWIAYRNLKLSQVLVLGRNATRAIRDYVEANDGAWPSSWEDLKGRVPTWSSSYPEEIVVDFSADPAALAQQSPQQFGGIAPRLKFVTDYADYWEVARLVDSLKRFHQTSGVP